MRRASHLACRSVLACALALTLARGACADEALLRDIRAGDYVAARQHVHEAQVNLPFPDGSTPLAWAVDSQDPQMVELLLEHGARADGAGAGAGARTTAPLLIACELGDPQIVALLVAAHADVNASRPDGVSALEVCAGAASTASVALLLRHGAQVEHADRRGQTPLMWAAARGRVETLRLLLAHHAAVNRVSLGGFTPLFFALKSGTPEAPVALLDAGGDPDHQGADGTTSVQLAMYQHDYGFAARLIGRGADLTAFDRDGHQLLHAAVLAHQPHLVSLLLSKGADVNAPTGPSRVEWRYERNFKSAPYVVPPRPPLLLAAGEGDAQIMQLLVNGGADRTFRASDGTDVLLAAAASGSHTALALALELQPDVNVANHAGETPLHLVLGNAADLDGAGSETDGMLRLLAQRGARCDLKNRDGQTAVDLAAEFPVHPTGGLRQQFDILFRH